MRLIVAIGVVLALAGAGVARKTSSLVDREADGTVKWSECTDAPFPLGGMAVYYPAEEAAEYHFSPSRIGCDTTKTGRGRRIQMRRSDFQEILAALSSMFGGREFEDDPDHPYTLGKAKTKFEFESLKRLGRHRSPVLELSAPDLTCLFCLNPEYRFQKITEVCYSALERGRAGEQHVYNRALDRCLQKGAPPPHWHVDPATLP